MKRFYFIFLPVVLVFLYSIPGVFCLSGRGGDSFLFIKKKTTTTVIRNFQPVVLVFLYMPVVLVFLYRIPGVFCLSGGGGIASSLLKKKLLLL